LNTRYIKLIGNLFSTNGYKVVFTNPDNSILNYNSNGLIIAYKFNRFILNDATFILYDDNYGFEKMVSCKGILKLKLYSIFNKKNIYIYNTHLQSDDTELSIFSDFYKKKCNKSLSNQLLQLAQSINSNRESYIIGDLNIILHSRLYKNLLKNLKNKNNFILSNKNKLTTYNNNQYDYIIGIFNNSVTSYNYKVFSNNGLSDHDLLVLKVN